MRWASRHASLQTPFRRYKHTPAWFFLRLSVQGKTLPKMGGRRGGELNTCTTVYFAFGCDAHQHKHAHRESEYLETCQHMLTPTASECPDNLYTLSEHLNLPRVAPGGKKRKKQVLLIPVGSETSAPRRWRRHSLGCLARKTSLSPSSPTPSKHPDTLKAFFFFLRSLFPV